MKSNLPWPKAEVLTEPFDDKKKRLLEHMESTKHSDDMYPPSCIQAYINKLNTCTTNEEIIQMFAEGDYLVPDFVIDPTWADRLKTRMEEESDNYKVFFGDGTSITVRAMHESHAYAEIPMDLKHKVVMGVKIEDDLDRQADIMRAERAKLDPNIPSEQARILEIGKWFERSFRPY